MIPFIVIQMGARLHYAVPALLAEAGLLARFYTDICVRGFTTSLPLPKPLRRLLARRLPASIPRDRVRAFPFRALLRRDIENHVRRAVLRDGFSGAGGLYTLSNGDIDVVRAARRNGLRIVHEQILNPEAPYILREERERFHGVEPQDSLENIEAGRRADLAQWAAADRILAPSDPVRRALLRAEVDPSKIAVVPYGIPESWLETPARRVPGRVLFVGNVGLLKGSHYLARAARLLPSADIRVVGPLPKRFHREFAGPTYVGQVPRTAIRREYLAAEVFVLPTLSEGCALAHLEALACGLPVITTPNCGSVVRDGVEGFIVPVRDPAALACRIRLLLSDHALRERMSRRARERAAEFTWPRFKERLLRCLNGSSG